MEKDCLAIMQMSLLWVHIFKETFSNLLDGELYFCQNSSIESFIYRFTSRYLRKLTFEKSDDEIIASKILELKKALQVTLVISTLSYSPNQI